MWFKNFENRLLKGTDTMWLCTRGILLSFLEEPVQTITQIEVKSSQIQQFSFTTYYIKKALQELEKTSFVQRVSVQEAAKQQGEIYDDILDVHEQYLQTLPPLFRANYKNKNYYILNNGRKEFVQQHQEELKTIPQPITFEEPSQPRRKIKLKSLEEEYPHGLGRTDNAV